MSHNVIFVFGRIFPNIKSLSGIQLKKMEKIYQINSSVPAFRLLGRDCARLRDRHISSISSSYLIINRGFIISQIIRTLKIQIIKGTKIQNLALLWEVIGQDWGVLECWKTVKPPGCRFFFINWIKVFTKFSDFSKIMLFVIFVPLIFNSESTYDLTDLSTSYDRKRLRPYNNF